MCIYKYIYIYIYKQRLHAREYKALPYGTLFEKRIEILLTHKIRTKKIWIFFFLQFNVSTLFLLKNKDSLKDSLFSLVQCFKINLLNFYSFIYSLQPFMPSHLKYIQTKNDVNYLQPFNDTYLLNTVAYGSVKGKQLAFFIE